MRIKRAPRECLDPAVAQVIGHYPFGAPNSRVEAALAHMMSREAQHLVETDIHNWIGILNDLDERLEALTRTSLFVSNTFQDALSSEDSRFIITVLQFYEQLMGPRALGRWVFASVDRLTELLCAYDADIASRSMIALDAFMQDDVEAPASGSRDAVLRALGSPWSMLKMPKKDAQVLCVPAKGEVSLRIPEPLLDIPHAALLMHEGESLPVAVARILKDHLPNVPLSLERRVSIMCNVRGAVALANARNAPMLHALTRLRVLAIGMFLGTAGNLSSAATIMSETYPGLIAQLVALLHPDSSFPLDVSSAALIALKEVVITDILSVFEDLHVGLPNGIIIHLLRHAVSEMGGDLDPINPPLPPTALPSNITTPTQSAPATPTLGTPNNMKLPPVHTTPRHRTAERGAAQDSSSRTPSRARRPRASARRDHSIRILDLVRSLLTNQGYTAVISTSLLAALTDFMRVTNPRFSSVVVEALNVLTEFLTKVPTLYEQLVQNGGLQSLFGRLRDEIHAIGADAGVPDPSSSSSLSSPTPTDSQGEETPDSRWGLARDPARADIASHALMCLEDLLEMHASTDSLRNILESDHTVKDVFTRVLSSPRVYGASIVSHVLMPLALVLHNEPTLLSTLVADERPFLDKVFATLEFTPQLSPFLELLSAVLHLASALCLKSETFDRIMDMNLMRTILSFFTDPRYSGSLLEQEAHMRPHSALFEAFLRQAPHLREVFHAEYARALVYLYEKGLMDKVSRVASGKTSMGDSRAAYMLEQKLVFEGIPPSESFAPSTSEITRRRRFLFSYMEEQGFHELMRSALVLTRLFDVIMDKVSNKDAIPMSIPDSLFKLLRMIYVPDVAYGVTLAEFVASILSKFSLWGGSADAVRAAGAHSFELALTLTTWFWDAHYDIVPSLFTVQAWRDTPESRPAKRPRLGEPNELNNYVALSSPESITLFSPSHAHEAYDGRPQLFADLSYLALNLVAMEHACRTGDDSETSWIWASLVYRRLNSPRGLIDALAAILRASLVHLALLNSRKLTRETTALLGLVESARDTSLSIMHFLVTTARAQKSPVVSKISTSSDSHDNSLLVVVDTLVSAIASGIDSAIPLQPIALAVQCVFVAHVVDIINAKPYAKDAQLRFVVILRFVHTGIVSKLLALAKSAIDALASGDVSHSSPSEGDSLEPGSLGYKSTAAHALTLVKLVCDVLFLITEPVPTRLKEPVARLVSSDEESILVSLSDARQAVVDQWHPLLSAFGSLPPHIARLITKILVSCMTSIVRPLEPRRLLAMEIGSGGAPEHISFLLPNEKRHGEHSVFTPADIVALSQYDDLLKDLTAVSLVQPSLVFTLRDLYGQQLALWAENAPYETPAFVRTLILEPLRTSTDRQHCSVYVNLVALILQDASLLLSCRLPAALAVVRGIDARELTSKVDFRYLAPLLEALLAFTELVQMAQLTDKIAVMQPQEKLELGLLETMPPVDVLPADITHWVCLAVTDVLENSDKIHVDDTLLTGLIRLVITLTRSYECAIIAFESRWHEHLLRLMSQLASHTLAHEKFMVHYYVFLRHILDVGHIDMTSDDSSPSARAMTQVLTAESDKVSEGSVTLHRRFPDNKSASRMDDLATVLNNTAWFAVRNAPEFFHAFFASFQLENDDSCNLVQAESGAQAPWNAPAFNKALHDHSLLASIQPAVVKFVLDEVHRTFVIFRDTVSRAEQDTSRLEDTYVDLAKQLAARLLLLGEIATSFIHLRESILNAPMSLGDATFTFVDFLCHAVLDPIVDSASPALESALSLVRFATNYLLAVFCVDIETGDAWRQENPAVPPCRVIVSRALVGALQHVPAEASSSANYKHLVLYTCTLLRTILNLTSEVLFPRQRIAHSGHAWASDVAAHLLHFGIMDAIAAALDCLYAPDALLVYDSLADLALAAFKRLSRAHQEVTHVSGLAFDETADLGRVQNGAMAAQFQPDSRADIRHDDDSHVPLLTAENSSGSDSDGMDTDVDDDASSAVSHEPSVRSAIDVFRHSALGVFTGQLERAEDNIDTTYADDGEEFDDFYGDEDFGEDYGGDYDAYGDGYDDGYDDVYDDGYGDDLGHDDYENEFDEGYDEDDYSSEYSDGSSSQYTGEASDASHLSGDDRSDDGAIDIIVDDGSSDSGSHSNIGLIIDESDGNSWHTESSDSGESSSSEGRPAPRHVVFVESDSDYSDDNGDDDQSSSSISIDDYEGDEDDDHDHHHHHHHHRRDPLPLESLHFHLNSDAHVHAIRRALESVDQHLAVPADDHHENEYSPVGVHLPFEGDRASPPAFVNFVASYLRFDQDSPPRRSEVRPSLDHFGYLGPVPLPNSLLQEPYPFDFVERDLHASAASTRRPISLISAIDSAVQLHARQLDISAEILQGAPGFVEPASPPPTLIFASPPLENVVLTSSASNAGSSKISLRTSALFDKLERDFKANSAFEIAPRLYQLSGRFDQLTTVQRLTQTFSGIPAHTRARLRFESECGAFQTILSPSGLAVMRAVAVRALAGYLYGGIPRPLPEASSFMDAYVAPLLNLLNEPNDIPGVVPGYVPIITPQKLAVEAQDILTDLDHPLPTDELEKYAQFFDICRCRLQFALMSKSQRSSTGVPAIGNADVSRFLGLPGITSETLSSFAHLPDADRVSLLLFLVLLSMVHVRNAPIDRIVTSGAAPEDSERVEDTSLRREKLVEELQSALVGVHEILQTMGISEAELLERQLSTARDTITDGNTPGDNENNDKMSEEDVDEAKVDDKGPESNTAEIVKQRLPSRTVSQGSLVATMRLCTLSLSENADDLLSDTLRLLARNPDTLPDIVKTVLDVLCAVALEDSSLDGVMRLETPLSALRSTDSQRATTTERSCIGILARLVSDRTVGYGASRFFCWSQNNTYPVMSLIRLIRAIRDPALMLNFSLLLSRIFAYLPKRATHPAADLMSVEEYPEAPRGTSTHDEQTGALITNGLLSYLPPDYIAPFMAMADTTSETSEMLQNAVDNLLMLTHLEYAPRIIYEQLGIATQARLSHFLEDLVQLLKAIAAGATVRIRKLSLDKIAPRDSNAARLLRLLTALHSFHDALARTTTAASSDKITPEWANANDVIFAQTILSLDLAALYRHLSAVFTAVYKIPHLSSIRSLLLPALECIMITAAPFTQELREKVALSSSTAPATAVGEASSTEHTLQNMTEPQRALDTPGAVASVFLDFTEVHRKSINSVVRQTPALMGGPFSVLITNPGSLDFDNKRSYFYTQLHAFGDSQEGAHQDISFSVNRDSVFYDSFIELSSVPSDVLRNGKLNIKFKGEEGVDAGGVTREWFTVLARQMFNPDFALFQPQAADSLIYQPNKASYVNENHLLYFTFIGRVIGKAIYDQRLLEAYFSRPMYKHILNKSVDLSDLEAIDPEYHKSLLWILQNDINDIVDLTFTLDRDDFGNTVSVDLVPDGGNIAVTDENKGQYVHAVVQRLLCDDISDQMAALAHGLYQIIPRHFLEIFNEMELELLISGLPEINVDEWRANTLTRSFSQNDPALTWFWRAVRSFSQEQRAKLLQFVSGSSRVPLDGFRALQGISGVQKFTIVNASGKHDCLPTAHTCFNQLDLPSYQSYDALRKFLLLAVTEGNQHFAFA